MTPAALVRSAARIARVEAAILDIGIGSPTVVFGLSDVAAADVLTGILTSEATPNGYFSLLELPVPLRDVGRTGRLLFLDRQVVQIDERIERALRVLAIEIGHEIDLDVIVARKPLHDVLGSRIEEFAQRIDELTDPIVMFEAPRTGNVPAIAYTNPAFEQFFGYSAIDVIGQGPSVLFGPMTDLDRVSFLFDRVRGGHEARSPVVFYKRDRMPVWIELSLSPRVEPSGAVSFYSATLRDVTARKEFEAAVAAEKRKLQVTLAAIGDGVLTTVRDGRIEFVNGAAQAMIGVDQSDAYGEPVNEIVGLRDAENHSIDLLTAGEEENGVRRGQALFGNGAATLHIAYVTSPIGDPIEGYVIVLRDVTAQHRIASQLSFEASHDALTGLFNRRKFEEVLVDAVDSARDQGAHHTLAYLDLDRFKVINDRCGHAVGDVVLADIAKVLQQCLRGRDVLARLGGDEFAVLLHDCTLHNARRVLEKLRTGVDAYRLEHGGHTFSVGVSIGLAPIEGVDVDPRTALSAADTACYAAKAAGRNVIVG